MTEHKHWCSKCDREWYCRYIGATNGAAFCHDTYNKICESHRLSMVYVAGFLQDKVPDKPQQEPELRSEYFHSFNSVDRDLTAEEMERLQQAMDKGFAIAKELLR